MLLWLNGLTAAPFRSVVEILIDEYSSKPLDLCRFLDEDDFIIQIKDAQPRAIDFVSKQRVPIAHQMVQIITSECVQINEENYKFYIRYPMIVNEIMSLQVPTLFSPYFDTDGNIILTRLFSIIDRQPFIPEPQLANWYQFIQYLMAQNPRVICDFVYRERPQQYSLVVQCLNHLYSAQIQSFLVNLLNPEYTLSLQDQNRINQVKLQVLTLSIEGFLKMDFNQILNVMVIYHEIMTRFLGMDNVSGMVTYIVSYPVIQKMFEIVKINQSLFHTKAAIHILSLISNYYSYSMQNITIVTADDKIENNPEFEYHLQLTKQFEKSDFMQSFGINLNIFTDILDKAYSSKPGAISFKIVEITDNLIRISNLQLWQKMSNIKILQKIIQIYLKFKNANIIHSLTEKMFGYILNRAISDFHPFWAVELFVKCDIITNFYEYAKKGYRGPIIQILNSIQWFSREIDDKLKLPNVQFKDDLLKIKDCFQRNSQKWIECIEIILDEGEREVSPQSSPKNKNTNQSSSQILRESGFQQTKNNFSHGMIQVQTPGDVPAEFDEESEFPPDIRRSSDQLEVKDQQSKFEINIPSIDEKKVIIEEIINLSPQKSSDNDDAFNSIIAKYTVTKVNTPGRIVNEIKRSSPLREIQIQINDINPGYINIPLPQEQDRKQLPSPQNYQSPRFQGEIIKQRSNEYMESPLSEERRQQLGITPSKRMTAMESSLKLKQLDEDVASEFEIAESSEHDRVLIQRGNKKVLVVDELDSLKEKESLDSEIPKDQLPGFRYSFSKPLDSQLKEEIQVQGNIMVETIQQQKQEELIINNQHIQEFKVTETNFIDIPPLQETIKIVQEKPIEDELLSINNIQDSKINLENLSNNENEKDFESSPIKNNSNLNNASSNLIYDSSILSEINSSVCSSASRKMKLVFRQSQKKLELSIHSQSQIQSVILQDNSYSERSSINIVDMSFDTSFSSLTTERKFRKIQEKDKQFIQFLKKIKTKQQI